MGCIFWMVHVMTKVYMNHIYNVMYGISVDLMSFDLGWPLKVKSNIIEFLMGCIFWMVPCYYKNLYVTHIVSHCMVFQLTSWSLTLDDLWPWMTFKVQTKLIECLVDWIVDVIICICVNNEQIWLAVNCGSDLEQYLNQFHFGSTRQPRWLSGLRRSRVHSLWLLVDHCVLRNCDRILVRAVKGLISRAGMVSICPLLWQRDVKLQQTNKPMR